MAKSKKVKEKQKYTWHFYVGVFCSIGAVVMLFNNIFASLAYAIIAAVLFRKSKDMKTEKNGDTKGPEAFAEESKAEKKPIYKCWWFWLLILVILLGGKKNTEAVVPEDDPPHTEIAIETESSTETVLVTETEIASVETTETLTAEITEPTVVMTEVVEETEYQTTYVLNTNSMKFHYSSCGSADDIKDSNKSVFTGTREELLARGYSPCGRCHP